MSRSGKASIAVKVGKPKVGPSSKDSKYRAGSKSAEPRARSKEYALVQSNSCRYGVECRLSHKRLSISDSANVEEERKKRARLSSRISSPGSPRGSKQSRTPPTNIGNQRISPPRARVPKQFGTCHEYFATISCSKGENCGYNHLAPVMRDATRTTPNSGAATSAAAALVVDLYACCDRYIPINPLVHASVLSRLALRVSGPVPRGQNKYPVELLLIDEIKEYDVEESSRLDRFRSSDGPYHRGKVIRVWPCQYRERQDCPDHRNLLGVRFEDPLSWGTWNMLQGQRGVVPLPPPSPPPPHTPRYLLCGQTFPNVTRLLITFAIRPTKR